MAKVVLGKRPKSFNRSVEFTMLDGDAAELSLTFKYRTKREFGALIDSLTASARQPATDAAQAAPGSADQLPLLADAGAAAQPAATQAQPELAAPKLPQLAEIMLASIGAQADYILQIAEGWDVPDTPFTREHVLNFCDEQPAGAQAVMKVYRESITEGRLGN